MTMYRVGPAGIPASLKTNMDAVLNKKFGTSTTYAPATWPDNVNLLGPLPEKTVSGSVASITDGADGVPLKNWGVTVDATLSGVSSVVCTQAKKNLIDNSAAAWESGTINASGNNASGTGTRTIGYFELKGGATITVSGIVAPATTSDFRIFYYDENKDFLSYRNYSASYIVPDEVRYIRIRNISVADISALQIEYGTATTYEPYAAPTVSTVNLGRTIYGGSADVVNGTGKEVYRLITFDGTQAVLSGNYGTGGYVQYSCSALGIDPDIDKPLYDLQPNLYVDATTGNYRVNSFESGGIKRIRFNDVRLGDTITSKDAWNANLSQNPVTIAYPIATPEDFTFTPITPTPETALGVNNFWADEGDSDVTYRADINMLIASLSGNRGLMMTRPQLEEITEKTKEEDPEVTEK